MDFDQERRASLEELGDPSFTIGGETFRRRLTLRPESRLALAGLFEGDLSPEASLAAGDNAILALIESEGHERWRELRAREDDALTNADITKVLSWLLSEASGRPTEAPGPSSAGRSKNGTGSTAPISEPAAAG